MAAKKAAGKKGKADKKGKGKKGAKKSEQPTAASKPPPPVPVVCQGHQYPGIMRQPEKLAVVGLQSADYTGLCQLLKESFEQSARALLITPWGPYAIFREFNGQHEVFFLYDGCSCLLNIFRFYDLKQGTAGFLYFQTFPEVVAYVLENRFKREKYRQLAKTDGIERLCSKYCTQGGENIFKICNRRGEISSIEDHMVQQCLMPRAVNCDRNSTRNIERELPSMKNQRLFKRVMEGKSSKKPKLSCR